MWKGRVGKNEGGGGQKEGNERIKIGEREG